MFKNLIRTTGLVVITLMMTKGFVSSPEPAQADSPITPQQQVGPGEVIAGQGSISPRRATAQLSNEPPKLTAEQLQRLEEAIANSRLPGPPLQEDPETANLVPQPAVPETPLGPAMRWANEPDDDGEPLPPNDYVFFRNVDIGNTANLAGFLNSINEPSADARNDAIFMTGNIYAAFSTDRGQFFQFVNPFTTFPASDNGFCCDQVVIYDRSRDLLFWLLQYRNDGTDNRQRLAVIHGSDLQAGMTGADWYYYDFNAASFGITGNRWLDYPKMALSNNFLYINTNVFDMTTNCNGTNCFTNAAAWRIPLSQLAAGGTVNYSYFTRTDTGSFMPTDGATTTMYWGTHNSLSQVRIYRWAESSGTIFWDNVNVATWGGGTHNCPTPDGNDPCAFGDGRMLAGWVAGGVISFMWNSAQHTGRPFPYVDVARFNQSNRSLINQPLLWHTAFAWFYPAIGVNNEGNIAGPVFIAGGGNYPRIQILVADDISGPPAPWENYFVRGSTNGPANNRWGDYVASRRHEQYPNTWTSTGFTLQGGSGNANTRAQWIWHGRRHDEPPSTPSNDDFNFATSITANRSVTDPRPGTTSGEVDHAGPVPILDTPGGAYAPRDPEKTSADTDILDGPEVDTDFSPKATASQSTTQATTAVDDPITSCGSTTNPRQSHSVWYRFIPPSTGNYMISTAGSNYDTVLALWTGSRGSLTDRGCDDDSGPGLTSTLNLVLNGGVTYYIEAMRYSSFSAGQLTLSVVSAPPPVPTNVQASDGTFTDRVRVTWNPSPGATHYEVYRATSSGGVKTQLPNNPTGTTYDDTSATPLVIYYYWVKACNNFDCSDFSIFDTGWRQRTAQIIVEKQTLPDGDPTTFNFTGGLNATLGDGQTAVLEVNPGQHTVTEILPTGWGLSNISCDDNNSSGNLQTQTAIFNIEPGERVTCTFTNAKDGQIIVEKQTLPDGDPTTFDFTGALNATLGDGQTAVLDVNPGQHTVTEILPAGWGLSDISCDDNNSSGNLPTRTATFNVDPGETVTCTFTNAKDGQIIVEKQTLPDGDLTDFIFTGAFNGTLKDGETAVLDVNAGQHTVTEIVPVGWALSDISCDDNDSSGDVPTRTAIFNVDPGETVTCIFTNEKPTAITLASFTAEAGPDHVTLAWETASEIDNEGFNLWRSEAADGEFTKLNDTLIPAQGNADTGASYEYIDPNVVKGMTYYYQLEDIDTYAGSTFHGPVSATPSQSRIYLPAILK